jgi:CheY-like chemotaxis protein
MTSEPSKKVILVVDDDQDMLNLVEFFLRDIADHVVCVNSGKEALDRLQTESYDLVISDIIMPEMSGIDLARAIKKGHPELQILACSEGGTSEARDLVAGIILNKAVEFGASFALKKPFSKKRFTEVVTNMLAGRVSELYED